MGSYQNAVITANGEIYLAKAIAGEINLTFSHMAISDHAYPAGTDLSALTSLTSVKMTVLPASVWVSGTTVGVRGLFSNTSVSTAYNIATVGVYATDGQTEILFSVSSATTPDEMPAYNGVAPSSFIFTVQEALSQTPNFTISVTAAGVATAADIADLQATKQDVVTGTASTIVSDNLTANRVLVTNGSKKAAVSSVTTTELGRLSGISSNVQDQLNGKQATITGAASTVTGSDLTANRALASNGSGKIAASSVTTTELGRLSGVTAPIQTQIDGKQATITGAATSITGSDLTASSALVSNASGKVAASSTTATELGYVHGVTSAIQTQLNGKQSTIGGAASTITDSNLDPGRALVSSPTAGKVIVSNTTDVEIARLSGVTSNVQSQLNGKAPNDHASSATTYGVGTANAYGHVKVANNLSTGSFSSTAPVVLSAYQGKLLNDTITAKCAAIVGANDLSTTISSGGRQNLLYGTTVSNASYTLTTTGIATFTSAGTYLMFTRIQMGSTTTGGVARLDLEARYREGGTTTWGDSQNIGSNWVTGTFGTVNGINLLTIPSDGYQMFLNVLAVDGAAKINAFSVTLIRLA